MQIDPHYDDVVGEVADFFRQQYERALQCGIDPMAIAFDPGIGFGKTVEHNLDAAWQISTRLRVQDRPLVVGVSRKSFLGKYRLQPRNVGSTCADDRADRAAARTRRERLAGA